MKRTIFIIAIVLSLISFPVMANANDTTEVNTTNPILQKKEVKLPWYKALSYETGYSGGLCYTGKDLMKYTDFDPLAFANPSNYLYWLNSVEISAIYPLGNKKGVEVGVGYGWARNLEGYGGIGTDIYNYSDDTDLHLSWGVRKIENYYLYMANLPNNSGLSLGGELVYSNAYGTEYYFENWNLKDSLQVIRNGIGGGIFIRWLTKIETSNNLYIVPFLLTKAAFSYEFHNNSPWDDMWKDKLVLNFSGIYVGVKLNFGNNRSRIF